MTYTLWLVNIQVEGVMPTMCDVRTSQNCGVILHSFVPYPPPTLRLIPILSIMDYVCKHYYITFDIQFGASSPAIYAEH